ncbi:branched-chain amino acid ABC transporter permease [Elioraea sp.]|uniref:branched-chain amino acid ABC transporter permease n=1 Tax=Elioraea sp. TaxID=2185103 RepID=UPI0025B9E4C3|nr:branched-chain amino acid ABC transporter permease [Elioraea sp.]
MRPYRLLLIVLAMLAALPLVIESNVALNFLKVSLMLALAGTGWNLLGGYGGQFSFGHAVFFGTGAYTAAVLQVRFGINAWVAFGAGIALGALVGAAIGWLTFRAGLRGSYFALVTLAFAEVARIIASVWPLTGAGAGILIPLKLGVANLQFGSRAEGYWFVLALLGLAMALARAIEGRRFGAQLVAVRENEDAAKALGVDVLRVKLMAIALSGGITASAGGFYAQTFLYLDAGLAYGPWISVEALLTAIVGGIGTVWGPLLGALVLQALSELGKHLGGDAPGLGLVLFGAVLIIVVRFAPEGIVGLIRRARPRRVARG